MRDTAPRRDWSSRRRKAVGDGHESQVLGVREIKGRAVPAGELRLPAIVPAEREGVCGLTRRRGEDFAQAPVRDAIAVAVTREAEARGDLRLVWGEGQTLWELPVEGDAPNGDGHREMERTRIPRACALPHPWADDILPLQMRTYGHASARGRLEGASF